MVDLRIRKNPTPKLGHILDFLSLREIEHNCLCLKHPGTSFDREYKAVVSVDPLNFTLLSEKEKEAVLESFRVFLNRLSYEVAIHIRIEKYDIDPYLTSLGQAGEKARTEEIRLMAQDHQQFVQSLASTHTLLQRKFYLLVPATHQKAKSAKHQPTVFGYARSQLEQRCHDLIEDLERAGISAHRLQNLELARYYQACVHSQQAREYPLFASHVDAIDQPFKLRKGILEQTETTALALQDALLQEAVASAPGEPEHKQKKRSAKEEKHPSSLVKAGELVAPTGLHIQPNYLCVRHNIGNEFVRSFALIAYPSEVQAGWFDRLVQIEEPDVDIMLYLEPQSPHKFVSLLSRKLTSMRATQLVEERHGRTPDPYVEAAKSEIESLRRKLVNKEEQAFSFAAYIMVRGASKLQLQERSNRVLSVLKSLELGEVELTFEHHRAWQSMLPEGRDVLKRRKILDTSSLMMAFPFSSNNLSTPDGILTGIMPNGSLVILNPLSDLLENGHEVKFARSGAGKSFDEKVRIGRTLLAGYDAIVVDPEGEYRALCEQFGGVNVKMASGMFQINPFDLPGADTDERNILEEKFQSLLALFDLLIADKQPGILTQREKAYLTRCLHATYAKAGITADRVTHRNRAPSMNDFYNVLRNGECGQDTYELADRLQRFVPSFPDETRINTEKPLIVFNIRDLDAESKPAALLLITDFVWTLVRRSRRPVPRLLSIDEAWSLLQFDEGGRFLASMARRARKYRLCLRIISQDVEDCLNSEWGRTILVNSAMKFLMKQDATTIDAVTSAFHLSEDERRYLLACPKGAGLFFARSSHVPLRVVASPLEFQLATTSYSEEAETQEQTETHQAMALRTEEENHYQVVLPSYWTPGASHNGHNGN